MTPPVAPLPDTSFARQVGIECPLICGPMYPCSNPELVAAVSAAGGIGVVQPVSITYVFGHDFRAGLRLIRETTDRPIGMNALIERASKSYHERMVRWVDIALEEGVRFFITSLGNPKWVVDRAAQVGGVVYHDVTERKWADKAMAGGVHGLIGVNRLAGGHAGARSPQELLDEVGGLGLPVICAGGVGDPATFRRMLDLGYAGVQMGTRFIATVECKAHEAYKRAIVDARAEDIVLTERLTGIPIAVIRNAYVERMGTRAGPVAAWLLRNPRTKRWMRSAFGLASVWKLKRSSVSDPGSREYWQAGKSVEEIHTVEPAAEVVRRFCEALAEGSG